MDKTDKIVKQYLLESFPFILRLREDRLLKIVKSGSRCGYVQCDNEASENLRPAFIQLSIHLQEH